MSNCSKAIIRIPSAHRSIRAARRSNPSAKETFFEPKVSEECKRLGICDNVQNYPKFYVKELVSKLSRTNYTFFNEDVLELPGIEKPLCDSRIMIYQPLAVRDVENQWYYVLNNVLGVSQVYRVEVCNFNASSPSNTECDKSVVFSQMYRGSCQQKFILRKIVALDHNGEVVEKHFRVPSCCSCEFGIDMDDY